MSASKRTVNAPRSNEVIAARNGSGRRALAAPLSRRIVKDEGVGAFYRGMGTKVTQTVFAAALMFAAKEEIAKAVRLAHAKMVLKQKMKRT